jgi:hypothetical protein
MTVVNRFVFVSAHRLRFLIVDEAREEVSLDLKRVPPRLWHVECSCGAKIIS